MPLLEAQFPNVNLLFVCGIRGHWFSRKCRGMENTMAKIVDGIRSVFRTFDSYYSAWKTFGSAAKIRAEAELLDALHEKIEVDKKYSELDENELKKAKDLLSGIYSSTKKERVRLLLLTMPFVVFLAFLYGLLSIFLEIIRIIFS